MLSGVLSMALVLKDDLPEVVKVHMLENIIRFFVFLITARLLGRIKLDILAK